MLLGHYGFWESCSNLIQNIPWESLGLERAATAAWTHPFPQAPRANKVLSLPAPDRKTLIFRNGEDLLKLLEAQMLVAKYFHGSQAAQADLINRQVEDITLHLNQPALGSIEPLGIKAGKGPAPAQENFQTTILSQ